MNSAETCECKGLNLFKRMVETATDCCWEEITPEMQLKAKQLGYKLYDHLASQTNELQNKKLRKEALDRLDVSRGRMAYYDQSGMGVTVLDEMRDALHKTPALRKILFCNKSPEGEELVKNTCDLLFSAKRNPVKKILPLIEEVNQKLNCDVNREHELTDEERLARLREKMKQRLY